MVAVALMTIINIQQWFSYGNNEPSAVCVDVENAEKCPNL